MLDEFAKEALLNGFRRIKMGRGWYWRCMDNTRRKRNKRKARIASNPEYKERVRLINEASRSVFGRRMVR